MNRPRTRGHGCLAAGVPLVVVACGLIGCTSLRPQMVAVGVPDLYRLVASPFLISTNFRLSESDPIVSELLSLRRQVQNRLHLASSFRPIEIYIFDDRASYEQFMRREYPDLPPRRAFFVAQGGREVVYSFRGERLEEDLRHEACHALLHASLPVVPLWLDEGLAEYFEIPAAYDGLHARHLREIKSAMQRGWRPGLTRLETLNEVGEMKISDYREAWAWVYFLLHGSSDEGTLLLAYLEDLRLGGEIEPVSARLFAALPHANSAMTRYFAQLQPPEMSPTPPVEMPGSEKSETD